MRGEEWPAAKVDRLRKLWQRGDSTSLIGAALGMSKNAVIGKVHRLGLDARPSPIRTPSGAAAVQSLAAAGRTKAEAAAILGVSYKVIRGVATREEIAFRAQRPSGAAQQRGRETATARAEERRAEVIRLKRRGLSNHDIAQEVHMRRDTIGRILKEAGLSVPRRPPTTPVVRPPRPPRQHAISFVSTAPTAPSMPGVTRFSCLAPGEPPETTGCTYIVSDAKPWVFCAEPGAVEMRDGTPVRRSFCAGHLRVCYSQQSYAVAA